jgi:hypothetical protein
MAQYERMYNSCRVPGEECDTIECCSRDKRHIVVLRNNSVMVMDVLTETGSIKVSCQRSTTVYLQQHHLNLSFLSDN